MNFIVSFFNFFFVCCSWFCFKFFPFCSLFSFPFVYLNFIVLGTRTSFISFGGLGYCTHTYIQICMDILNRIYDGFRYTDRTYQVDTNRISTILPNMNIKFNKNRAHPINNFATVDKHMKKVESNCSSFMK